MAEPLSITAGIIAVLQLTAKAVQYLNDVKDAPTDRQQILIEISSFTSALFNAFVKKKVLPLCTSFLDS